MMTADTPLRPIFYFAALGLTEDATPAEVKSAYANLASNGLHPDHGGDAAKWTLITAAYNELKAIFGKKRGQYTNKSDALWLRDWLLLHGAEDTERPAADAPKAEQSSGLPKFVFAEREGESKDERRKRYARESQQFRYATDPYYAAKRKESSLRSHAKKAARDKAAREAASAAE
jgi:DnaJ-class molecular chaperone